VCLDVLIGNSWGKDANGKSCLGCGPQEQFFGCADVAIGNKPKKPRSKKKKSTAVARESLASAAKRLKMTTDVELITTTTQLPKTKARQLKTTTDVSVATKSTSAVTLPPLDQHDRHKRLRVQTTTVPYHLSLMMSTASYLPVSSAVAPTLINTAYTTVRPTSTASSLQTIATRGKDDVVEHQHETMFAGQKYTMVVYSKDSRKQATEAAKNISQDDLVGLDPTGSLYVVPAWYVIVDQDIKQVNVIEPVLLAEITARLMSNGSR